LRLHQTAVVHTDDPANPQVVLTLSGHVIDFASIIPKRVALRGSAGQPVKGRVTIVPREKYPFKIIAARAWYGDKIRFKYEEIKNSNPKGYLLTIENLLTHKGRYVDAVVLKTDSPIQPEITIQVYADIAAADQEKVPIQ